MFDLACFYGHHEYDLAIAAMFGGFPRQFWDHYHAVIPKAAGWNNRHKLYKLFHNLNNHWSVSHYIYLTITNTHTHTLCTLSIYIFTLHYFTQTSVFRNTSVLHHLHYSKRLLFK